jgi:ammonia channel protein AmtB
LYKNTPPLDKVAKLCYNEKKGGFFMHIKELSKRKIEVALFIVIWVFTLLSLAFPFLTKSQPSFNKENVFSGFSMMKWFRDVEPNTAFDDWLILFTYIVILACLTEAIVYGVLCRKKSENLIRTERIFVILNLVLVFVYILNGIQACWAWNGDIVDITPSTLAHIPFIIVSILTAVYFILPRYIKKHIAKKEG